MAYSRNILVVRLSALGDILISVPLVKAYAAANPKVLFTLLYAPVTEGFFKGIENVRFIPDPLKKEKAGVAKVIKFARRISKEAKEQGTPITMVADIHDVLRTKVLRTWFKVNGIKCASIDKGRSERKALTREKNKVFAPIKSSMRKYEEVFVKLGLKDLNVSSAQGEIKRLSPSPYRKIGIAPFTAEKGKQWPLEYVEESIRILSADPNNRIFLFGGGKSEVQFLSTMAEKYPNTVSEAGKHKLIEEAAIIADLDVMVTMDSANMHLASVVGTAVISIWGATHPYAGFYGYGQNPDWAMGLDMPCRPCSIYGNKPCTKGDYPCLRGIKPQDLVDRVIKLTAELK